jgi:hypothetical protein
VVTEATSDRGLRSVLSQLGRIVPLAHRCGASTSIAVVGTTGYVLEGQLKTLFGAANPNAALSKPFHAAAALAIKLGTIAWFASAGGQCAYRGWCAMPLFAWLIFGGGAINAGIIAFLG